MKHFVPVSVTRSTIWEFSAMKNDFLQFKGTQFPALSCNYSHPMCSQSFDIGTCDIFPFYSVRLSDNEMQNEIHLQ